jgi:hypothetical protein
MLAAHAAVAVQQTWTTAHLALILILQSLLVALLQLIKGLVHFLQAR